MSISTRLDRVLDAAVAQQRVVGAIAAVLVRGEVVYHRAVGLADREAHRAMTPGTPHRLASLTKPVTTVAALALVDRGVLALDQPVTRWLPAFRPPYGDTRPTITLHHLLTHTSGLGYSFLEPPGGPLHQAGVSDGLDRPGLALDENLRRLAGVPLQCAPGTAFHYSLSTDVLGGVIERAADAPLPEVIRRFVTGPLELPALSFAPRTDLATPYADGHPPYRIEEGKPVPFVAPCAVSFSPARALDPASYPSGGAGILGTALDFARFLDALRTRKLASVSTTSIDAMLRDQIAPLTSDLLGPGYGYGYGVAVLRDPEVAGSTLSAGAVRWGGAYGHSWFIDPGSETTSVLLTNTAFEAFKTRAMRGVIAGIIQHHFGDALDHGERRSKFMASVREERLFAHIGIDQPRLVGVNGASQPAKFVRTRVARQSGAL
ncbi:MAG: serine hydrolase domain-containing protein, partial [Kofleriaceae bacterium]